MKTTPEERKQWREEAKGAMRSAVWEYCPSEFLDILDDLEELLRQRENERCHRTIPGGGFAEVSFCTKPRGHSGVCW